MVLIGGRVHTPLGIMEALLIEGGRVAEYGAHEELMALGGKYAEMYKVQSQYYK